VREELLVLHHAVGGYPDHVAIVRRREVVELRTEAEGRGQALAKVVPPAVILKGLDNV
jgi:hypothetical protein